MVPSYKFWWGNDRGPASGQNSVVLQSAVFLKVCCISLRVSDEGKRSVHILEVALHDPSTVIYRSCNPSYQLYTAPAYIATATAIPYLHSTR